LNIVSVFRVVSRQYVTVSKNGMLALVMRVFGGLLPSSTGTICCAAGAEVATFASVRLSGVSFDWP
jgi:hypothetical protein